MSDLTITSAMVFGLRGPGLTEADTETLSTATETATSAAATATDAASAIAGGFLPDGEYSDCGYPFAVIDTDFRIRLGVPEDETAEADESPPYLDDGEYSDCGNLYGVIDTDFRLLEGVPDEVAVPIVACDQFDVVQQTISGKTQVFSEARASGKRIQLSAAGSNNTLVRVTADGYEVHRSDRAVLPPGGLYAAPLAGGAEVPVAPYLKLVGIGDSQIALGATDGTGNIAQAAAALGWTGEAFGVGGQTAQQTAARYVSFRLALSGNQIPASAAVTLTAFDADPITAGVPNLQIHGVLAGVAGVLTRGSSGTGTFTFTRDAAGGAIPCPPGSVFYADGASTTGFALVTYPRDWVSLIMVSRNGYNTIAQNVASIRRIIGSLTSRTKRVLIPLVLPAGAPISGAASVPAEPTGSSGRAQIDAMNAALTAAWPDNVIDFLAPLQAASSGSSDDTSDVANGYVPRSLRQDELHRNAAGRAVEGTAIANRITANGWTLA